MIFIHHIFSFECSSFFLFVHLWNQRYLNFRFLHFKACQRLFARGSVLSATREKRYTMANEHFPKSTVAARSWTYRVLELFELFRVLYLSHLSYIEFLLYCCPDLIVACNTPDTNALWHDYFGSGTCQTGKIGRSWKNIWPPLFHYLSNFESSQKLASISVKM